MGNYVTNNPSNLGKPVTADSCRDGGAGYRTAVHS